MAPEILTHSDYGKSVDIWACGVIFYILLTGGRRPVPEKFSEFDLIEGTQTHIEWIIPPEFSQNERNLFENMMELDTVKRYTTREILLHPWVTGEADSPIPKTVFQAFEDIENERVLKMYLRGAYFLSLVKNSPQFGKGELNSVRDNVEEAEWTNPATQSKVTEKMKEEQHKIGIENEKDSYFMRNSQREGALNQKEQKERKHLSQMTKSSTLNWRNERLLKQAQELAEEQGMKKKVRTPSQAATPNDVHIPHASDSSLPQSRLIKKQRSLVRIKLVSGIKRKQIGQREGNEWKLQTKGFSRGSEAFSKLESTKYSLKGLQKKEKEVESLYQSVYHQSNGPYSSRNTAFIQTSKTDSHSRDQNAYQLQVGSPNTKHQLPNRRKSSIQKLPPISPEMKSFKIPTSPSIKAPIHYSHPFRAMAKQGEKHHNFLQRLSVGFPPPIELCRKNLKTVKKGIQAASPANKGQEIKQSRLQRKLRASLDFDSLQPRGFGQVSRAYKS